MSQAIQETYSNELEVYVNQERAAVEFLNSTGKLLFDKSIELVLFRNHLVDTNVTEILRLHKYAAEVVGKPISVFDTTDLAKDLYEMDLAPAKIDIGKLASEWLTERDRFNSRKDFLEDKLSNFMMADSNPLEPRDVVLFGFGRIGRLAARELIRQAGKGQQLRLRAIVTRKVDENQLIKRASLLENDSVHGKFAGSIEIDFERECLIINGQRVQVIGSSDPSAIDYTKFGIENALLIDNTGAYRDHEALSTHL
ncbi:MAG: glyceraldehyde 3-phosphate dehydrogenase NAD-binding domain-containing protein, partial [Flavobacteriales bacterium]